MGGVNNPGIGVQLNTTEAEAFNGTSPNPSAFTDLDLSSIVGACDALVILKCKSAAAGADHFCLRKNGDTEVTTPSAGIVAANVCYVGQNQYQYVVCVTDQNGVVEWYYTTVDQANTTIDVVGFLA